MPPCWEVTEPPSPVAASASPGAAHEQESTAVDAHPRDPVVADRGAAVVARRALGAGEARHPPDPGGGARGGDPGCAGAGLLRARRRGGPRLSQRLPHRSAEDGGGGDRVLRAAGRRAGRAVPLRDPRARQGPDRGAGGAGRRDAGAGPVGAGHRGRLSRRRRAAAAVAHGGVRARRAAVAGLPGLRRAGPERARDRPPVRGRHRRARPPRSAARARHGGLGLHGDGPARAAAPDGGVEGG